MTEQFKDILNKLNPEILENPDIDLAEEGIIDSFGIMNLVAALETELEIDFDPTDLILENFASAEAIWAVVQKYLEEKNAK